MEPKYLSEEVIGDPLLILGEPGSLGIYHKNQYTWSHGSYHGAMDPIMEPWILSRSHVSIYMEPWIHIYMEPWILWVNYYHNNLGVAGPPPTIPVANEGLVSLCCWSLLLGGGHTHKLYSIRISAQDKQIGGFSCF